MNEFSGKHIHMVGIGGASMSGIALLLQSLGATVSGSDAAASGYLRPLDDHGILYHIGHDGAHVGGADLVVYSGAVPANNPELVAARNAGIPLLERAQCLGRIFAQYENSIAVAGCHGKTTVTSMIGRILVTDNRDPVIHVGAAVDYLQQTGTRLGDGNTMVIEACEFQNSFHHFFPKYALVNNIDDDHLDFFHSMDGIMASFATFLSGVLPDGIVFGNCEDPRVMQLLSTCERRSITYGAGGDFDAKDLSYNDGGCATFTPLVYGAIWPPITLQVPGAHNVQNALGAIAVCLTLGCSPGAISTALAEFHAAQRRFESYGSADGVAIYHDYAHHPTEISATLQTVRRMKKNKVIAVFQCYTYSRSETLFDRFVEALSAADIIVIAEICGAREHDHAGQSGQAMADALIASGADAVFLPDFPAIAAYLRTRWAPGDIVVTMGAGDIGAQTRIIVDGAAK